MYWVINCVETNLFIKLTDGQSSEFQSNQTRYTWIQLSGHRINTHAGKMRISWTGCFAGHWTLLVTTWSAILCHSIFPLNSHISLAFNPLKLELNSICYLLALLGAHHFLHVSRIRVKLLTLRWLMSYIYGAPILDVSRSHTTTQHSR